MPEESSAYVDEMTPTTSLRGRAADSGSPAVFLSAAEVSGDWAGALLANALRAKCPGVRLFGLGGARMAAEGVDLIAETSDWGAIGVFDALRKIPRAWSGLRRARADLAAHGADVVVLIDSGGVNIPLARMVKRLGPKILYYLPPGSWSRTSRKRTVQDLVDVIATPFAWSKETLAGGRARVEWVGHPVLETVRPKLSREEAQQRHGIDPTRPVLAVAPGSREQEMRFVLPVLAEAASQLTARMPGLQLLVPTSNSVFERRIQDAFQQRGLKAILLRGMEYDALQLADAAAVCSGTATLEFACLRVPMVIVYRAGLATTFQYVLFRGILGGQRYAGMPNIIAQREIVPELLRRHATPEAIARELGSLLVDQERRAQVRSDLDDIVRALGTEGASDRTAELVLELAASDSGVIRRSQVAL
ncbi:MAG: lipid-A-disaccharide synthase [Armatimonadetes bacterium]|nr:lipid-A-disaccharide synthase [Armatimonadota bacterium]